MKFTLKLDESLFDDDIEYFEDSSESITFDAVDDDFSAYEGEHSTVNVPSGPAPGSDTGVYQEMVALINDEWEAIQGYTNMIAVLRQFDAENEFYKDAVKILEEISAEENVHVGQLQELLKRIAPNANEIAKGEKEAVSQLKLIDGRLPVESWDSVPKQQTISSNVSEEMCTLCDIDDEM